MNIDQQYLKAVEFFSLPGRMISASKSSYRRAHPDNKVVFNGNLCTEDGKIWYGDIDVTLDELKIDALAQELGKTVYVLSEFDARFDNEETPQLDKAVYTSK